jgi:pimeloyl-ACP methyl ester carboxylesterase
MTTAPLILVPGFWLGAWAWDDVADRLRADGQDVTALTLPGLESIEADRSGVTAEDHVAAICAAMEAAGAPVVLAVHSGAGYPGYAATDRCPDRIAHVVYVDTGPGVGAPDAEFAGVDKPLDWTEIEANENLDGLSEAHKAAFRARAVPEPGGVMRGAIELSNPARLDIPSTVICTAFSSDEYKEAVEQGYSFLAGLKELRNVTYVDLPTSHWPMWSRPGDLARILGEVARSASR